eukprot:9271225-Ditylum_brightwellii.AAC.1
MSVDIADFNITESSASYCPLKSAEATAMNESVMSESESSVDHQTNSICSFVLDGIESLCQLCTPMSVASEYHLTRSSINTLCDPYSLENEQVCVYDMKFTDYRQCVVCNFEGEKCDPHRYIECANCK